MTNRYDFLTKKFMKKGGLTTAEMQEWKTLAANQIHNADHGNHRESKGGRFGNPVKRR